MPELVVTVTGEDIELFAEMVDFILQITEGNDVALPPALAERAKELSGQIRAKMEAAEKRAQPDA